MDKKCTLSYRDWNKDESLPECQSTDTLKVMNCKPLDTTTSPLNKTFENIVNFVVHFRKMNTVGTGPGTVFQNVSFTVICHI